MNLNFSNSIFFKTSVIALSVFASAITAYSQANAVIHSTNGYDVNITLDVVQIIAPSSCPYGYNYNTKISYNISFTGSNKPSNLYTLQTTLECGSQGNFVSLPLNGGSGLKNTSSNPWNSNTDCQTVTPESLNCYIFNIVIEGPGISARTIQVARVVALPVKLISFVAEEKNSKVELNWMTSAESNNSHFRIERSVDGITWKAIDSVYALQNQTAVNAYSYTDKNGVEGLAFYRLAQVDLDGKATTIDKIVAIHHTSPVKLSVYPNPANTFFSIEGENIANAEISIVDAMGRNVNIVSQGEMNKVTFDTNDLPNGIYSVKVNFNDEVKTFKVTVSK